MAHNQYLDKYEMFVAIDKWVDYHASFVNPEGVKAVLNMNEGLLAQDGVNFTRTNQEFREKKNKILTGEKVEVNKDANESVKDKMLKMKKKISEAKEGFITVGEDGKEVFVEGRKGK